MKIEKLDAIKHNIKLLFCLAIVVLIYTLIFTVLFILRYRSFFAETWEDLAIYNQILWNIVHGNGPYCSITQTLFFGHFTPILYLVALPYAFWPHIYSLYFILSLSFALGAIPLFMLSKRVFSSSWMALYIALIYLLLPTLHFLNLTDFRPILLCIPLLLCAFYFFYEKRFFPFVVFIILSAFCYETVCLNIIFFGIYALMLRRSLKWVIVPILIGTSWFIISVSVMMPALGYKEFMRKLFYAHYIQDATSKGRILYIFSNPSEMFKRIISKTKFLYIWHISGLPYLFLPYLSPLLLIIALPTYLGIALRIGVFNTSGSHHVATIIPFLAIATVFGLNKCLSFFSKHRFHYLRRSFLITIFFLIFLSNFGYTRFGSIAANMYDKRFMNVRNIFDPIFYIQDEQDKIALKLIAMIPKDASVTTSGDLLPQLSHRKTLYEFGVVREVFLKKVKPKYEDKLYLNVDYILFRTKSIEHGAGTNNFDNAKAIGESEKLIGKGLFRVMAREGDFILLRRF